MYMTFKGDMFGRKKGDEIVLKVTEFNTFDYVDGYDEPMVVHLNLITTGFNLGELAPLYLQQLFP